MASEVLLQMRGIGKSFPGVQALAEVTFELRAGEVHVLLGENGAGKSTLMRILSGACQPDHGAIWLEGRPVTLRHPRDARRLGISTVYQEFNLVPQLSVAENLFLGRESAGGLGWLDSRAMRARAAELLAQWSINLAATAPVGSLSVAQQQMVEVARALAFDSRILILDEPTSVLTDEEIRTLFGLIRTARQRGVGIIYISHRLEEIFELGDRVTVLRDGRWIATRPVAGATVDELVQLMAGRHLTEHYPHKEVTPGPPLLQVEDLCAAGKLKHISFELRAGEILGIAGLLGSGRSTLARVLFGVQPAQSGAIRVRGRATRVRSPARAIHQGFGYLAEDRKGAGLVLSLSVRQNFSLANSESVYPRGVLDSAKEETLARRWIARLGIKTPDAGQQVVRLSGGNQQKVVLGKWLERQANILVFDEPTRGIDVAAKVDIYRLMNGLKEQGAGILMISSELPEVLGMSDRILVMRRGEIAAGFNRGEADQAKVLKAALAGKAEPRQIAPRAATVATR